MSIYSFCLTTSCMQVIYLTAVPGAACAAQAFSHVRHAAGTARLVLAPTLWAVTIWAKTIAKQTSSSTTMQSSLPHMMSPSASLIILPLSNALKVEHYSCGLKGFIGQLIPCGLHSRCISKRRTYRKYALLQGDDVERLMTQSKAGYNVRIHGQPPFITRFL